MTELEEKSENPRTVLYLNGELVTDPWELKIFSEYDNGCELNVYPTEAKPSWYIVAVDIHGNANKDDPTKWTINSIRCTSVDASSNYTEFTFENKLCKEQDAQRDQ